MRIFIFFLSGCVLFLVLSQAFLRRLGNAHHFTPGRPLQQLSQGAQNLIAQSFADLDVDRLMDYHVHLVATGSHCAGCYVNADFYSWKHLAKRLRFAVYRDASGVRTLRGADRQYVNQLYNMIQFGQIPGRFVLLGFDAVHNADGLADRKVSEFYVDNDYLLDVAELSPQFLPAISVHPARKDAIRLLEKYAGRGVRFVKWLPNAMQIDPARKEYVPFYRAMRRQRMILITHAGEEAAVEAASFQEWGNPLRLRLPLKEGVRIIVAHAASLGKAQDLDDPARPRIPAFHLFLRLFTQKKYKKQLFADISAMTQFNRIGEPPAVEPLKTLLERPDLQSRLVNGSDYPLPAINLVIRTSVLQRLGYISPEERVFLNEIYDYNPLLFDFVLKRTLRHPRDSRLKLAPEIFMEHELLQVK
ncbi:MAG: hypothetical protein HS115_02665 [Spirochaetales bacterium]|nr:hypothetical protein [Spirochaetales bacterium]